MKTDDVFLDALASLNLLESNNQGNPWYITTESIDSFDIVLEIAFRKEKG